MSFQCLFLFVTVISIWFFFSIKNVLMVRCNTFLVLLNGNTGIHVRKWEASAHYIFNEVIFSSFKKIAQVVNEGMIHMQCNTIRLKCSARVFSYIVQINEIIRYDDQFLQIPQTKGYIFQHLVPIIRLLR